MENNLEKAAREYSVENPIEHGVQDIDESYYLQKPKQDFIAGANWQKEQMLKDAIEVKINRDTLYDLKSFIHDKYQDYKIGDKLKIIIVKEEEKLKSTLYK